MCFMTALSSVPGGALTSKTLIVFDLQGHKDSLLAKSQRKCNLSLTELRLYNEDFL